MPIITQQQKMSLMDDGPGYLPGYAESAYGQLGLSTGLFNLRTYLNSGIDDRLSGSPSGDALSIHSTYAPTVSGSTVYNTNLWGGSGTDISQWIGIIWYSDNPATPLGNGTAITTRHVITTDHGAHADFDTIRWILADGTFVDRQIYDHAGAGNFRVYVLTEDIPATVPIIRLFGTTDVDLAGMPIVMFNNVSNQHKARIADVAFSGNSIYGTQSVSSPRSIYWVPTVFGDSGAPMYVVYGRQLVYLGNLTSLFGYSIGPSAIGLLAEIQNAIASLNTEYSLSAVPEYLYVDEEFEEDPMIESEAYATAPIRLGIGLGI